MNATARPIVVGIDGSEPSRRALTWAIREARMRQASLVAVMCEPENAGVTTRGTGPGMGGSEAADHEFLETKAARLVEDACVGDIDARGVEIHVDAHLCRASERLVNWSERAQLVVVGARGYDRLTREFLGSVARTVTQHARCPVIVVP